MGVNTSSGNERIIRTIMKELCRRNNELRIDNSEQGLPPNVFVIEDILKAVLSEYSIVVFKSALREFMFKISVTTAICTDMIYCVDYLISRSSASHTTFL
ncbi:MAG TPA: hypothetical protein VH500_24195 [Nitrososphaeraceae archaeon]|jgi:hypothetical protein